MEVIGGMDKRNRSNIMNRPTIKTGSKINHDTLGPCTVIKVPYFGTAIVERDSDGKTFNIQGLFAKFIVG